MIGLKQYILFDLRSFYREPMALLFTFVLPAVFYIAASIAAGDQQSVQAASYSAGFIGIIIMIVTLFTVGPSLVLGRELGFYKRVLATPLDTSVILISAMVRAYIVVLGGMLEIVLLGFIFSGGWPDWNFLQFMLAMAVSAASIFSFGVLLGSIFTSTRTAFAVSVILLQPLMFLSGATIPFEQMGPRVQAFSKLLPTTHMVEFLRMAWGGELFSAAAGLKIVLLLAFGLACCLAARRLFRWSTR